MPLDRSRALVLTAVGSLFLAACSGASGTGKGNAAGKPVSGGSLTYAVDTEPVSFDIHASPQDITGASSATSSTPSSTRTPRASSTPGWPRSGPCPTT